MSRENRGQMTVEFAVLMPVVIVVALVVFNLTKFCEMCAVFDRVSKDAVLSQGVAPSGDQATSTSVDAVRSAIEAAVDSRQCEIEVTAERSSEGARGEGVTFPVSPLLTTYHCNLRFRPWPSSFSLAGVLFSPPPFLVHERTIVVDRFRPGVVV